MGGGPVTDGYLMPAGMSQGYGPMAPSMGQGYMPMAPGMGQGPVLPPAPMPTNPVSDVSATRQHQLTNYDGVQGTLGLTYQLPSKRVNATKHPRDGLLQITVSDETFQSLPPGEEIKITVEDEAGHFDELEGYFGDDNKWHFKSEALYPGIPNIYDVTFESVRTDKKREKKGDKVIEIEFEKKMRDLGLRRVRLIPGRTVYLNFP